MSSARKREINIAWEYPSGSSVKLNVDSASKGNPGQARCGCVIRDHEGYWITGAAQSLGFYSAYKAEL